MEPNCPMTHRTGDGTEPLIRPDYRARSVNGAQPARTPGGQVQWRRCAGKPGRHVVHCVRNPMPTAGDREPLVPPALRLTASVLRFLFEEAAGGVALMVAAAVALGWANSPWRDAYTALWATPATLRLANFTLEADFRHWVGDGLMAVFFLVVGLEIKRELVAGELRTWRGAALPVVAAAGGMAVPALVYAAVNAGRPGAPAGGCRWPPTSPSPSASSPCSAPGSRRP